MFGDNLAYTKPHYTSDGWKCIQVIFWLNNQRIVLDPIFPPPQFYSQKKMVHDNIIENNKLELIFDENDDGPYLIKLFD